MNREEFLNELAELLCDISETERTEALQYYREYFEDANMPDEEVIRQLGSASSVANSIREELADKEPVLYGADDKTGGNGTTGQSGHQKQGGEEEKKKDNKDTWIVILLVLVGILGAPIIIGVCMVLFGVLLAVVSVLLGIVLTSAICTVSFGIAAIAALIAAFVKLPVVPVASPILLGMCLICTGICFLSLLITMKMCTCILPGFFTGLGKLLAMPFRKK